jgi:hypothetical protein
VLELSVALGNERAARQALLSAGAEATERVRQSRAAWERELDGERVRASRREAVLVARVEELEAREEMRREADGAAAASAQTGAALLHQLQMERARRESEAGVAAERVAACERALRRERRETATLREALEVARDEVQAARAQLLGRARGQAAARVRSVRSRRAVPQLDVAGLRGRYMTV